MGDEPRERGADLADINGGLERGREAATVELDDVLGMVSERAHVLAAEQAAESEVRLVGNGYDDVAGRDPGQLADRRRRIVDVLEDLQAEDEVEAVVGERQWSTLAVRAVDSTGRRSPDAIDAVGGEVDSGYPLPRAGGPSRTSVSPSPHPASSVLAGASGATISRRRSKKPPIIRWTTGLRVSNLTSLEGRPVALRPASRS